MKKIGTEWVVTLLLRHREGRKRVLRSLSLFKKFFSITVYHTPTLALSVLDGALHFIWHFIPFKPSPLKLPYASWAIPKSVLRQPLGTDTQQMQNYNRNKSLLLVLLSLGL